MLEQTHLRKPKCAKLCISINHKNKYFQKSVQGLRFLCVNHLYRLVFPQNKKVVIFCPLRKHFEIIIFFNVNKISHVQLLFSFKLPQSASFFSRYLKLQKKCGFYAQTL